MDLGSEPVVGRLAVGGGAARSFTGYAGLIAALQALREGDELEGAPLAPEGEGGRAVVARAPLGALLAAVAALAWCAPAHAAGWLVAEEVAPAGSMPATTDPPVVAMTPAGDVFAGWTSTGDSFAYRVRRAFTGYAGDPQRFAGNDLPAATVDGDGRIWLATHLGGVVQVVRSNATDPGSFPEGGSFLVPGAVTDLDVAVRQDEAAVVFVNAGKVKLGRWTPTGGAVGPTTLYDGSMNDADHAKVTLDAAGNLVAGFTIGSQNNTCRVASVRIPAGGSPVALQDIGSTGSADGGCSFHANGKEVNDNVDLALGPTGRVLASWYRNGPTHAGIDTAVAPPGGAFGAATTVATDADARPLSTNPPSVAHGLLGASDAMLHTYIVRSPDDGFDHAAQLFRAGGGAPGFEHEFDIGNRPQLLARNAAEQAVGGWQGSTLGGLPHQRRGRDGRRRARPRGDDRRLRPVHRRGDLGPTGGHRPGGRRRRGVDGGGRGAARRLRRDAARGDRRQRAADRHRRRPGGAVGDGARRALPGDRGLDLRRRAAGERRLGHPRIRHGGTPSRGRARARPGGNTTDVERTVTVAEASGGGSGGSSNGSSSNSPTTANNTTTTTTTTTLTPQRVPGPTMALLGCARACAPRAAASSGSASAVRPRAPGGCSGTAGLQKGAPPRAFRAGAGATTTAKLKLTRSTRRRLSRRHRLRVTVAVTAHDGQGNEATSSGAYTVLSPRR